MIQVCCICVAWAGRANSPVLPPVWRVQREEHKECTELVQKLKAERESCVCCEQAPEPGPPPDPRCLTRLAGWDTAARAAGLGEGEREAARATRENDTSGA
jgi:hypothetical protein